MNNAISPKYCNLEDFALVQPGSPVLWVRGEDDAIVSDTSLLDFGYLGQLDFVPGWPGAGAYPPQPMVSPKCSAENDDCAVAGVPSASVAANAAPCCSAEPGTPIPT